MAASCEVILVTGISGNTLTVTRGYGGTTKTSLSNALDLYIIGNAAARRERCRTRSQLTIRSRQGNYTQIFSSTVQVSGTEAAVRQIQVDDELDYQKTYRLREMLRDLENTLINGLRRRQRRSAGDGDGAAAYDAGIIASLATNLMTPGSGLLSSGTSPDGGSDQRGATHGCGKHRAASRI